MRFGPAALALLFACKPPVPILNYHSVGTAHDEFAIPTAQLAEELDLLAAQGRRTVSLRDLAERRFGQSDVVLTFDDGFTDALTTVVPMLRQRGMRASFFIVPGFVGKPGFLDWDGVRALQAAGMEVGSHTVEHERLGDLPDGRVSWELAESKRLLDAQLPTPVEAVAYPYNSVRARILAMAAEAGYRIGVSGPAHGGADPLNLARISVYPGLTRDQFETALRRKK
jgi:peptidoglycan/xylan/chitin deacetylase (PgdA/CDA1 family)